MNEPPHIDCPFPPCLDDFDLIRESDDQLRIPLHNVKRGITRYGGCPASLMAWPLDETNSAMLGEQYDAYRRERHRLEEVEDEQRTAAPVSPPVHRGNTPVERDRRPIPDKEPHWFRPSPRGSARHHPGVNVRDERMLPGEPGRPVGRAGRWPAQDFASGGDGRVRHIQCGHNHLPGQPCPPGMPRKSTPPPAPNAGGTVTPIGRTGPVSKTQEAAALNQAAINMLDEASAQLARLKEELDEAVGLFSQAHDSSPQDGSQGAMEMTHAAKERIDEAKNAIFEAVSRAQSIVF